MQQMWRYGLTGTFLILGACYDIKSKKIPMPYIVLSGMAGILINLIFPAPLTERAQSMCVGIFLLLLAKVTEEQVGYGDGLVLLVTGLFLNVRENLLLFLTGLFLCGCAGIFLLVTGKAARKTKLPFIPFLAGAYLFQGLQILRG